MDEIDDSQAINENGERNGLKGGGGVKFKCGGNTAEFGAGDCVGLVEASGVDCIDHGRWCEGLMCGVESSA